MDVGHGLEGGNHQTQDPHEKTNGGFPLGFKDLGLRGKGQKIVHRQEDPDQGHQAQVLQFVRWVQRLLPHIEAQTEALQSLNCLLDFD